MTSLLFCPVCAAPTPSNRITGEPWCCSIDCFRTFHRIAAPDVLAQGGDRHRLTYTHHKPTTPLNTWGISVIESGEHSVIPTSRTYRVGSMPHLLSCYTPVPESVRFLRDSAQGGLGPSRLTPPTVPPATVGDSYFTPDVTTRKRADQTERAQRSHNSRSIFEGRSVAWRGEARSLGAPRPGSERDTPEPAGIGCGHSTLCAPVDYSLALNTEWCKQA